MIEEYDTLLRHPRGDAAVVTAEEWDRRRIMRIYFYYNVDWPFKIIPMHLVMRGVFPKDFEHVIVDSGVNKFFKQLRLKEYPPEYLKIYPRLARRLCEEYGDAVWVVIPDYPDDYAHNRIPDNTERTLRNIRRFLDERPDVNWMVVIQARWGDVRAFAEACRLYRAILGDYPRIAVGTLCTHARQDYAIACCRLARKYFPRSWIHVFGPNMRWLRRIAYYVDSIDTIAYYKPPHHIRGKGVHGLDAFVRAWLERAARYLPGGLRIRTF